MVFPILKRIIFFIPNKVVQINEFSKNLLGLPKKASEGFITLTRTAGATTGAAQAGKGVADVAEAIYCQDGICAFVSTVGVCADLLQIAASFVPGPNVTCVITMPVSYGCKTFVWACKKSKLPWGGSCK